MSEGTTNIADLEASVNDINKQEDIDFVIFAGDITEFGSDREISIAAEVIGRLNKPYIVLSGNHDSKWSESGCNTFAKVFGYEFFRLDIGDFVFLGCNSGPNMRMAPALVPRESILKLRELSAELSHDLSAKQHEKGAPNVVFINHYPLDDAMLNWREVTTELRKMKTQLATELGYNPNDVKSLMGDKFGSNTPKMWWEQLKSLVVGSTDALAIWP